jgi:TetR/AcrR family transcriptional regulator, transcriptional repressor for nem operon
MNDRYILFVMNEKITKGQKTKELILKKANQLFSEKGFDATGVDEIVGSLNLTSGVFYNYFGSKNQLLKHVVDLKIQRSKDLLLVTEEKQSAISWVQKILTIYLSVEHRDAIQQSCPITTLSQELIKLNLHQSTGLSEYTKDFAEILNRRLMMISSANTGLANAVMSLCIGALILSRLESQNEKSLKILNDAYHAALKLIEQRRSHVSE